MQQLDPNAVWIFFFNIVLRWFSLIFVFTIFGDIVFIILFDPYYFEDTPIAGFLRGLWFGVPAFFIFAWIWAKLTYHFYRYELQEDGFREELGVIWKRYVVIPYDRIQNVDIHRGVIARILGLSDLRIYTAGTISQPANDVWGGGAEGRLPGLSREVAEQLRDELVKRVRQTRITNQGL